MPSDACELACIVKSQIGVQNSALRAKKAGHPSWGPARSTAHPAGRAARDHRSFSRTPRSLPPSTTPITVYAASSLIGSFTAIGKEFEAQNPGYSVEFIFAGSEDLVGAITDGATPDVFVSGDRADITALAEAGTAPVPFAANDLVIATAAGNPRNITALADLARPGLRVAVCAERSACGTALGAAEARDKVRLQPRSADDTPGNILKAVASGQVDAGVVLRTNALGAGDGVSWFALPGAAVTSWVTVIKGTDRAHEAAQFVAVLTGEGGRKILAANGFVPPVTRAAG